MTRILGIETSCDETAASVVRDGRVVLSNIIASQHDLHERFGGVVPEIASRAHLERITPVITEALDAAQCTLDDIDAIAVGNRPGLIGSLLVGVSAAKALTWSTGKPLIGVDHVRAHLYAGLLTNDPEADLTPMDDYYPALGLVVSGGHTSLYNVQSPLEATLLGSTIDDAVGEAYDKAAVILNAGYPGGPALDKLAQSGEASGDPSRFNLPRSLLDRDSLDFSYSGLKTALLYQVRGHPTGRGKDAQFPRSADDLSPEDQRDLAAAFQRAAIDCLIIKLQRATDLAKPASILVGGGVSANSLLRKRIVALGESLAIPAHIPAMAYCLDNAAMIAGLAHHQLKAGAIDNLDLAAIATTGM